MPHPKTSIPVRRQLEPTNAPWSRSFKNRDLFATVAPRNTGHQGTNKWHLLLADFRYCQYRKWKDVLKGPRFSVCYWRISVTHGSGVAGFNCSSFLVLLVRSAALISVLVGKGMMQLQAVLNYSAMPFLDAPMLYRLTDWLDGLSLSRFNHCFCIYDLSVCLSICLFAYTVHEFPTLNTTHEKTALF